MHLHAHVDPTARTSTIVIDPVNSPGQFRSLPFSAKEVSTGARLGAVTRIEYRKEAQLGLTIDKMVVQKRLPPAISRKIARPVMNR